MRSNICYYSSPRHKYANRFFTVCKIKKIPNVQTSMSKNNIVNGNSIMQFIALKKITL